MTHDNCILFVGMALGMQEIQSITFLAEQHFNTKSS